MRQAVLSFYRTLEEHDDREVLWKDCPRIREVSCCAAVAIAFEVWPVVAVEDLLPARVQLAAFAFDFGVPAPLLEAYCSRTDFERTMERFIKHTVSVSASRHMKEDEHPTDGGRSRRLAF